MEYSNAASGFASESIESFQTLLYGLNWNVKINGSDEDQKVRQRAMELLFEEFETLPQILLLQEVALDASNQLKKLSLFEEIVEKQSISASNSHPSGVIVSDGTNRKIIKDITEETNNGPANIEQIENAFLAFPNTPDKDRMAFAEFKISSDILSEDVRLLVASYHAPSRVSELSEDDRMEQFHHFLDGFKTVLNESESNMNSIAIIGCDANLGSEYEASEVIEHTVREVVDDIGFDSVDVNGGDAVIANATDLIQVSKIRCAPINVVINKALESLSLPQLPIGHDEKEYEKYFDHQPLFFKVDVLVNREGAEKLKHFHRERIEKKLGK